MAMFILLTFLCKRLNMVYYQKVVKEKKEKAN